MGLKRCLICAERTTEETCPSCGTLELAAARPRRRAPVSKWDLLEYLEEAGHTGVTAWEVAEWMVGGGLAGVDRRVTASVALLRLRRQSYVTRAVESGGGRRGLEKWQYRYRITERGRARLAWWRRTRSP
jgi:hypothetical protein